jgi:hypothetical protein
VKLHFKKISENKYQRIVFDIANEILFQGQDEYDPTQETFQGYINQMKQLPLFKITSVTNEFGFNLRV